ISELGDIDTTVVTLRFQDGALGVLQACRNHPTGHDVRAELVLTRGALHVGNPPQTKVLVHTRSGVSTDRWPESFLDRFRDAYQAEMQAFASALLRKEPVPVPGEAALGALRLVRAATASMKSGAPVSLGEKGDAWPT